MTDASIKKDYVFLGYVRSSSDNNKKYALIIRGEEKRNMKNLECNCPSFFFRANKKDGCKHIQKFLFVSDEVPYNELVPPEVELEPEGKDSLVRFRIDNNYDVYQASGKK